MALPERSLPLKARASKSTHAKAAGIILLVICLLFAAERAVYEITGAHAFEEARVIGEELALEVAFQTNDAPLKGRPGSGAIFDTLSNRKQKAYEKLYKALWVQSDDVSFSGYNDDELFGIYCQVMYDHPELIHVGHGVTSTTTTWNAMRSHSIATIHPEYLTEEAETAEGRTVLETQVTQIASECDSVEGDEAKAVLLHGRLCDLVRYEEDNLRTYAAEHTALGALCDGKAVCEGYALAYALLCQAAGLECQTIVGYVTGYEGSEDAHAWNKVKVNGQWMYVDSTFDDGNPVSNKYLLQSEEFMDAKGYQPFANNILPELER